MSLEQFRKLSLSDIARQLGLKPLDVARILGQQPDGMPRELQFSPAMLEQVRELAGVEVWWSPGVALPIEDSNHGRSMVRALAQKLVEHHEREQQSTRADNLFRGLNGVDQLLIRRTVNQMIREGLLQSVSRVSGLHVVVDSVQIDTLKHIADGTAIPDNIAALWS